MINKSKCEFKNSLNLCFFVKNIINDSCKKHT